MESMTFAHIFWGTFFGVMICEVAWVIIKPQLIKRAARQGKNMYSETWFSSFRR